MARGLYVGPMNVLIRPSEFEEIINTLEFINFFSVLRKSTDGNQTPKTHYFISLLPLL